MTTIIAIILLMTVPAVTYWALPRRRSTVTMADAYKISLESWWKNYQEWCDSRICIGGCGKAAKDRPRDASGICTEPWITEELCEQCWLSGVRGVSAERAALARAQPGVQELT